MTTKNYTIERRITKGNHRVHAPDPASGTYYTTPS